MSMTDGSDEGSVEVSDFRFFMRWALSDCRSRRGARNDRLEAYPMSRLREFAFGLKLVLRDPGTRFRRALQVRLSKRKSFDT